MSNSSYLRCLGEGVTSTNELYAEYTLPDGWARLFAPEDFYVGHPRDNPVAPELFADHTRETTSYLLCKASDALARFAERMRAAGVAVTGKGTTAKVHAWLGKHMGSGWWFADTTELEWWESQPGQGAEAIRRMLAAAASSTQFVEPTAATMLKIFGSGTGLSAEELARKKQQRVTKGTAKQAAAREAAAAEIAAARLAPVDVATLEGRPYGIRETYEVGDQIAHPVFKSGVVTAVTPTTITVTFPTGPQLLAHGRK